MDIGKLVIFGILGLLLLALWDGGSRSVEQTSQTATVVDVEETVTETQPAPRARTSEIDNERHYALAPADQTDDERTERAIDEFAPYEYVRERDRGTSNTYSYRVQGYDQEGRAVEGSVNTRGVYGKGYVTTEDGDHYWIITEWTTEGDLIAEDDAGNSYILFTSEIR